MVRQVRAPNGTRDQSLGEGTCPWFQIAGDIRARPPPRTAPLLLSRNGCPYATAQLRGCGAVALGRYKPKGPALATRLLPTARTAFTHVGATPARLACVGMLCDAQPERKKHCACAGPFMVPTARWLLRPEAAPHGAATDIHAWFGTCTHSCCCRCFRTPLVLEYTG